MKLLALRLCNFRSFTSVQTFTFPDSPGLYFMWGDNKAEPRLEGNGAGKSTLWKALTWVLFEKTSEGLKAGDVVNWSAAKGGWVELDYLSEDGHTYTLRRSQSPNSWTLRNKALPEEKPQDLAKDSTNPVLAELRLTFQPFLSCVLMAQGQPMFLDLKAEPKAALFAEVMMLDRWLVYSTRASETAKREDARARKMEAEVAELRGRLAATLERDVTAQLEEWERQRGRRLDSLEFEYHGLIARQKLLQERLKEKESKVSALSTAYSCVREAHDDVTKRLEEIRGRVRQVEKDVAKTQHLVDSETDRAVALKDVHACPLCEQAVAPAHARALAASISRVEAAHLATLGDLDAVLEELCAEEARLSGVLKGLTRECKEGLAGLESAQQEARSLSRDIPSIDRALDNIEDRARAIEQEPNPYASIAEASDKLVDELRTKIKNNTEELDAALSAYSLASSWVRWFKEIRLALIGEALEQLEVEVNSCVNALGLTNWELRFDVDKETAKGTLQRGFTVSVIAPHNNKPVPWEAWSGGESQRLRLAANMGLANLIRARTGTRVNVEVWDEPTQWMTAQGVEDLLDSLAQRAETEQRQVWIVDHRTLGYARFTGSAGVIKNEAGSQFDLSGLYISEHAPRRNLQKTMRRPVHAVGR